MPGAEVDGTKQDACRVTPRNRDMGLFALQSPRTTQDGKEAQHRLILTEEDGVAWELPEPVDYRPFFAPGMGLSPHKNSGAACSVTPWLSSAAGGYGD
jgi:hypothetical protein